MNLLGGERLDWSSRAVPVSERYPADIGGPLVNELIRDQVRDQTRVLIVGQYELDIVQSLAQRAAHIDLLTSSVDYGQQVEDEIDGTERVTVFCGASERFVPAGEYDVVVALGGRRGVTTPDSRIQSERSFVELVLGWVSTQTTLLLGVENSSGLSCIAQVTKPSAEESNDYDWQVGSYWSDPLGIDELVSLVKDNGSLVHRSYAVYGAAASPTVLADEQAFGFPVDEFLGKHAINGFSSSWEGPSSVYPPALAREMIFGTGVGFRSAPAWIVVSGGDKHNPNLYDALVVEPGLQKLFTFVWRFNDGRWGTEDESVEWESIRRLSNAPYGVIAAQGCLADSWRRCLNAGDRKGLVESLRGFRDFLRSGLLEPNQGPFAGPTNVTHTDSGLSQIDSTWAYTRETDPDIVFVMHLRQFTYEHLVGNGEHWGDSDISADELASRLAWMVDLDAVALLEKATLLEVEITKVVLGLDEDELFEYRLDLGNKYSNKYLTGSFSPVTSVQQAYLLQNAFELARRVERLERLLVLEKSNVDKSEKRRLATESSLARANEAVDLLKSSNRQLAAQKTRQAERAKKYQERFREQRSRKQAIEGSRSYKIGRTVTKPMKLFRKGS